MTISKQLFIILTSFILLFTSCIRDTENPSEILGVKAIYLQKDEIQIGSAEARPFDCLGKIVLQNPYIYINEKYQGVHVIDNTDPEFPITVAFWNIPGNIDFTINGDIMFADNSRDIYVIDISDIQNIVVKSTQENAYTVPRSEQFFPPDYLGSFECVDTSLGIVIGWENTTLIDPKCWR
jgi:hypothetical protein